MRNWKFLAWGMVCWVTGGCNPSTRDSSAVGLIPRSSEAIVAECALCHSTKEAQRGPILHGMDEWYLLGQIEKFRSGVRGKNPDNRSDYLMGVAVKKIRNEREMVLAAKWFAKQAPMPAIRTVSGDLPTGSSLYAARCAVCHGEKAEGKREFASPSLNRLEGWYFLDQMRKFRNGMRGRHELDFGGQVMAAAVADLTKQQMQDVVAYVVDTFGPPDVPSLRQRFQNRVTETNSSKE